MKRFEIKNINTKEYWDTHQTALDFGLRQQKYLDLAGSGESIVELGCGLSPMLANASNFTHAVGVDYSLESIKKATELYPKVYYTWSEVINTPFPDESFDAVVSGEVIEHLENPELLIIEMNRICKTGGVMVLSTPHLEFEDPEHLWEFYEQDFIDWGFQVETVKSDRFKGREYIFAWKTKK